MIELKANCIHSAWTWFQGICPHWLVVLKFVGIGLAVIVVSFGMTILAIEAIFIAVTPREAEDTD
ncbi:MAG TPA: hypothetical protein PLL10_04850 [Elusimicrobiales bacterium]|nr:hypothetical protein [Elusimicrobiales bacterium]